MESKLIKGTFVLAAGSIFSRMIGLIYVIPFYHMVGKSGQALYLYSYNPYVIFISLSTAGIPLAVAKLTAKYNALEEYAMSQRLFNYGQVMMVAFGVIACILLNVFAPLIAKSYHSNQFTIEEITFVIRVVSVALLIIPSLSLFRGYFQGYGQMLPTSFSQVIEQVARIVFLITGVYIVVVKLQKGIVAGIGIATAAAFVGALAGLAVLYIFWHRQRNDFAALLANDKGTLHEPIGKMIKEVAITSIPFILVALTLPIFQLIDNVTFNKIMASIGQGSGSDATLGILNYSTHQLIMIPLTLATGLQMSIIPNISRSHTLGDRKLFVKQLDEVFMLVMVLLIPASLGLSALSEAFYTAFYVNDPMGTKILSIYALIIILFALATVSAAILQSINLQRFSIKSILIGFVVKLIGNLILIRLIGPIGVLVASGLGYTTIAALNMVMIARHAKYRFAKILRRGLLISLMAVVMTGVVLVLKWLLSFWLSANLTRAEAIITILVCVPIGAVVYTALAHRSGLLTMTFGAKVDTILHRFRFRRN